jgi:hypothetical protein
LVRYLIADSIARIPFHFKFIGRALHLPCRFHDSEQSGSTAVGLLRNGQAFRFWWKFLFD